MSNKKTYKSFKEFAQDYLKKESYDDANFVGVGGFSIGSLDSFKPEADLGDSAPVNQGGADSRGTRAELPASRSSKNLQKSLHTKKISDSGQTMTGHPKTKIIVNPKESNKLPGVKD